MWLIFGANGQLGLSLQKELAQTGRAFVALSRTDVDITDLQQVNDVIDYWHPAIIVNAAAWTNVDSAESHVDDALAVNATGAKNVSIGAAHHSIPLIHVSTDYVFDGEKSSPYSIDDATNPVSVYGKSKLLGEQLVTQEYAEGTWIVRTAWLYSPFRTNFARTILRKALSSESLTVVSDVYGQPTSASALARQLIVLTEHCPAAGIFHGTNSGQASWYEFADALLSPLKLTEKLQPVSSSFYQSIAERPKYSVLDHESWSQAGLPDLPHWRDSLSEIHASLVTSVKE